MCPPAVGDQETEYMKQVFWDLEKQTQHSIASSDNRERNEVHPRINMVFWLEAATPQTATKGCGTVAEHRHLAASHHCCRAQLRDRDQSSRRPRELKCEGQSTGQKKLWKYI